MDNVYLVYEGTYEGGHSYDPDGFDRILVAVYPIEDMARHHLELWASKTLEKVGAMNKRYDEYAKHCKNISNEYGIMNKNKKPVYWVPDITKIPNVISFSRNDDQIFCCYEEHKVLKEVKVE